MPSPAPTTPSALMDRLAALRATMRRRLLAYGICTILSGGVFAFLFIAALDWLLELPGVLRLMVGASFIAGFFLAFIYWIVQPMRASLSHLQLAGQLEKHFPELNDRLSSTVSFLVGQESGSTALRQKVIARTDEVIRDLPVERILTLRPLLVGGGVLVLSAVILAVVVAASPHWPRTGVSRYMQPFGKTQWPHNVEIVPLTGDRKVAYGESLTVTMQIVRGAEPNLRGVVRLVGDDGRRAALTMHRRSDDVYACQIDNITSPLTYWFEAGDDSTASRPSQIKVVQRPQISAVSARLHPPVYTKTRPDEEVDLSAGAIRVVKGSRLSVIVQSSKPVGVDTSGVATAELMIDDRRSVPLAMEGDDPTRVAGELPIDESMAVAIRVTDHEGFTSRPGPVCTITADPDEPPTVDVVEPRGAIELTPSARVRLRIRAQDDLSVADVRLAARKADASDETIVPLGSMARRSLESGQSVVWVEFDWEIASVSAMPGETIVYRALATDEFPDPDSGERTASSRFMHINIISREDFERRMQADLVQLEVHLREALAQQEKLLDRTRATRQAADDDDASLAELHQSASAGASAQARLSRRVDEIAGSIAEVVDRLNDSGLADAAQKLHLESVLATVAATASGSMADATHALDQVDETSDAAGTRSPLEAAATHQAQAAGELRNVLKSLGEWGGFAELVSRTRDLLDRQQQLRADTDRQSEQTLGQPPESLPQPLQDLLRGNARRQQQLADETERLLQRMRALSDAGAAGDAETAAVMDATARAAAAADIVRNMRESSQALGQNRTSAAQIGQRSAESGLTDMLSALRERRRRQLERLVKAMEDAREALGRLVQAQRELLTGNQEALRVLSAAEVFMALGDRQRLQANNTRRLASDWSGQNELVESATTLADSAAPMQEAAELLANADGSAALDPQTRALALLEALLAELDRLAAEAQDEADKFRIAATLARFQGVRQRQGQVNEQTAGLIAELAGRSRLNRLESRKTAALARDQHDIREESSDLRAELEGAVVYDFVLARILSRMADSLEQLNKRTIDDALAQEQAHIAEDLDLLIAALGDIFTLPSPDEFERGGGGSGGAEGEASANIPALSELLVLKAMQTDLNTRTQRAAAEYDPATASEAQLQQVRRLAAEQQQIRTLTERVIEEAQSRD